MSKCVLCKREARGGTLRGLSASRTHPVHERDCPGCGDYDIQAPAKTILEDAVRNRVRTRKTIVTHFRPFIRYENEAGRAALITVAAAQAFCHG